jgi:hypothetical protein
MQEALAMSCRVCRLEVRLASLDEALSRTIVPAARTDDIKICES